MAQYNADTLRFVSRLINDGGSLLPLYLSVLDVPAGAFI